MGNSADEKRSMLRKFRNYYLACRFGHPDGGLSGTNPLRAFRFAIRMTWWAVKYGDDRRG